MLYNGPNDYSSTITNPFEKCPNDYSSTITNPFEKCPNINLSTSSTSACLNDCKYSKNVLYDMKTLNTICPRNRTYEKCIDDKKSLFIFSNLFSNDDIRKGKCGDLTILASTLSLCTPGMERITNYYSKNSDSTQTFAKEIRNVCKFQ
jgi:hypothetical protein